MTSVTTLHDSSIKENFVFYKDVHQISVVNNLFPLNNPDITNKIESLEHTYNITSEKNKIFITLSPNFYHFHIDSIAALLHQYNKIDNAILIIDISLVVEKTNLSYYNFFIKCLDDAGIEYVLINCHHYKKIIANNFYIMKNSFFKLTNAPEIVFNFYKKYIKNLNIKPYRNTYLARKDNKRILNDANFQKYLKDNNFEIVYAEDFKNFEDQINYFYTVKTLLSVTGSGLTNAIFMQNNTVLAELVTPFLVNYFDAGNSIKKEIHHFYKIIAFFKNQLYISITNDGSSIDNIIKYLNSLDLKYE